MSQGFQRARTDEQIDQRRTAILNAASELLAQNRFADLTLTAIAKRSGHQKSNLYRYYESREDILLQLLLHNSEQLKERVATNLSALPGTSEIASATTVLANAISDNPEFCQLFSNMASTIEENISVERLQTLKLSLMENLTEVGTAMQQAIPSIDKPGAIGATQMCLQILAGLWPLANPNEAVKEALDHPELSRFNLDFRKKYSMACYVVFVGVNTIQAEQ